MSCILKHAYILVLFSLKLTLLNTSGNRKKITINNISKTYHKNVLQKVSL